MTHPIRYDNAGTARFITFSCYRCLRNFDSDRHKDTFVEYLHDMRHRHQVRLYGYVIMPTHVHLVLHPLANTTLRTVVGQLKSLSARAMLAEIRNQLGGDGVFWQRRYYDHNCREVEYVLEKIRYCHNNPVVAGLVDHPSQWKWSSYNWYQGNPDVPIVMDVFDAKMEQT